jgi:hypothetical protein
MLMNGIDIIFSDNYRLTTICCTIVLGENHQKCGLGAQSHDIDQDCAKNIVNTFPEAVLASSARRVAGFPWGGA